MSYIYYLACSRELPTGYFALPPKAVYDGYLAYMNSEDYVVPRNTLTNEPIDQDDEYQKKLYRLKGQVAVYEKEVDTRSLWLRPYVPVPHEQDAPLTGKERMLKNFSLPYLYNLDWGYPDEFLCKYLRPGDQAELYVCWAGEECWEKRGKKTTVDLADFKLREDAHVPWHTKGGFVTYLAPGAPILDSPLEPMEHIHYTVSVVRETGRHGVRMVDLDEQGLIPLDMYDPQQKREVPIREASPDEAENVSFTLATCWRDAYRGILSDAYLDALSDDHWVEYLRGGTADCLVAAFNKTIVGVTIFGRSITDAFPEDGEIISLYLVPEVRGFGVGHRLLEQAEQRLAADGYEHSVICVFADNVRARAFYGAHGYGVQSEGNLITMGEQSLQYAVMRKRLSGADETAP